MTDLALLHTSPVGNEESSSRVCQLLVQVYDIFTSAMLFDAKVDVESSCT